MVGYYPVNLVLKNKKCLVIGAGEVAERKVRRLLECGARVLVVSPASTSALKAMADKGKIRLSTRKFNIRDLKGAYLVVAATADRKINSTVSSYCLKRNILVNVVDSPKESNLILPSIVRRGALTIAISTDGISPALSKKIRQDLEKTFGPEYAALLRIMKILRPQVMKKIKGLKSRRAFYKKALQDETLDLLKKNKTTQVMRKMKDILDDAGA